MDIIYWTWSKKNECLEKSLKNERPKPNLAEGEVDPVPPETLEEKIIQEAQSNFIEENKREQNSERLSKREWMANVQINPFHKKNNYINDISIQDKFLRPKNSNFNVKNNDLNEI